MTTDTTIEPAPARPSGRSCDHVRRLLLGDEEEPRWARPLLWAILVLAAVLYTWGLSMDNANGYYAAAVWSGTKSWKAFFFGSLDAGSYITVDKPPMALWVMGLSARVFGFNAWSILLPQAAEGVATVAILYAAVRRASGPAAGLIAGLVLTLTPVVVAIDRDTNPDPLLVLLLVVAAWACLRAIESGRPGWPVLCAVAVGCAFNTKMLQAFVALPALVMAYLLAGREPWLRRIRQLLVAGVALAVSGLWWLLTVDLIPASRRPYIGSSRDGTVLDLVLGYNGAARLVKGSAGSGGPGGAPGLGRMFNHILGGQISWLLPCAAVALAAVAYRYRRRPRTDLGRASLILWGAWLAVHYLVLSFATGTFHPYYTNAMAPAIAALTGIGTVALAGSWALPSAVAAGATWSFLLLHRTPGWPARLSWMVAAVALVAVLTLAAVRIRPNAGARTAAIALGTAAVLAGSAAYAVSPLYGQMASWRPGDPLAGPSDRPHARHQGPRALTMPLPAPLIDHLVADQGRATWLLAVPKTSFAYPLILRTGRPVMALGGFTGKDNAITVPKLQGYIRAGRLHYLLIFPGNGPGPVRHGAGIINAWVQRNCGVVDPAVHGSPPLPAGQVLYHCR